MRILFLAAKLYAIEPFGIMCLSPHLKASGHCVRLTEAEDPDLADKVREYEPSVIAYSVCSGSERYYLALNSHLEEEFDFVAVFGGPHPTFFPEMIHEPGVDAICRGEGDFAFAEFCDALEETGEMTAVANFTIKKKDGRIETSPPRPLIDNLDDLPFPDRELYYSVSDGTAGHRIRSFLAARGCPFACSYCFNPSMDSLYGGTWRRVRRRSARSLVDDRRLPPPSTPRHQDPGKQHARTAGRDV